MSRCLSVLMTVYNGEAYLAEAIKSILVQSFGDFEFLIIDNASTDASRKIVRSFADARIRLVTNHTNLGPPRALNQGLRLAKGTYVARMDADDAALPDRLKRQFDLMEKNPALAVVGTQVQMIDSGGAFLYAPIVPTTRQELMWKLMFTSPLMHASVMLRRQAVLEVGGYNEDVRYTPDYDLWSRMIERGYHLTNMPNTLTLIRIHPHADGVTAAQAELIEDVTTISARNLERFLHLSVSRNDVRKLIHLVSYHQRPKADLEDALRTLDAIAHACATAYGPEVLRAYGRTLLRIGVTPGAVSLVTRAALILRGLGTSLWPLDQQALWRDVQEWVLHGRLVGAIRLWRYRLSWKGARHV